MRAKGTLAIACALFSATLLMPPAEAANPRQTQKQARPGLVAAPAQPAPATVKPGERTGRQATTQRQGPAPARAVIPPQAQAQAALLTPAVLRGPGAGIGTPILPVAVTSGLSCVPFARMATGMNISGDARLWWYNAAGSYARGQQPERGSVLAFAASGGMSRGHVAVVSRVVNPRTILIDHANWAGPGIRRGTVMRGVTVVDVSDRNDWTAVRVQTGWDSDTFGRTYATYGFIYNRAPDGRTLMVNAPRMEEVAQAPSPHAAQHARLAAQILALQ
jgi:hypothetical protein